MSIYTVHAPPPDEAAAPDLERFAFVRDGFYVWAFVFGPLWLLSKRLWRVLLFYIVLAALLHVPLWLIGVPPVTHSLVSLFLHLLVGLEAATLRRWTLNQNDWTEVGIVSGDRYETAERRFFDGWVTRAGKPAAPPPAQLPPPPVPAMRVPPPASDIIGLFPEPQSRQ
jgi:Protein of unknown function (DUF2628)